MGEVWTQQFPHSAQKALQDAFIQRSLRRLSHFHEARAHALAEIGLERWEALREQGRRIKAHTIRHLDHYLEMLAQQVERHGGKVCWASTAQEANTYVLQVARRHGARLIIKSKSMVSEEMGLTQVLEAAGIETVETDLGEYIIQLAGERPFHIIAPAIHKSKEEVSDLFVRRLGAERVSDIPALAGIARRVLRQKFIQADIGITGVNFAVAETGTIVLVTNEGNGRMCTSMPRVHIAIMGMEKVIPRWEDLAVFIALLTRAATGQRISSYVTFVTGPRRADEEDGPEEFHLVILDNGRSRMLEDPELQEALFCIRCGACLNACPVYGKVGGHAYGWVYPGPIGSIVTPMLVGLPKAKDLPNASSLCGACREVCPLRINIPHMLLALRQRLSEGPPTERKVNLLEKALMRGWLFLVEHPWAFTWAGRVGSLLQRPLVRGGHIPWLPPPLNGWTRSRDFPPVAHRSFRLRWKALAQGKGGRP
ncbi:MAG: LutB/LldF family L-lactate oxidation iron-sulfur protein [Dehalococcoidia bacterium]|nr:LutB/LldF family L-lactate oxidation iron-sulfur protein [Dehalococcoidia bacterium]MDW8120519.1 LutB/LldF family L-lactate oxidation iron-sulfur protein [Chloroflexota bacterium]